VKSLIVLPILLIATGVQADSTSLVRDDAADPVVVLSHGFEAELAVEAEGPRPPVRVPRTEFDTAHRFNMDSGKKLTAAEFDAWLASMGARVVGAEAAVAAVDAEAVPVEAVATTVEAQPAPATEPIVVPALPQAVKSQVVE
jgi:hypothetical protein